jgi:hypothetical protein
MKDRDITVGDGFRMGVGLFLFVIVLVVVVAASTFVGGVSLVALLDAVTNR